MSPNAHGSPYRVSYCMPGPLPGQCGQCHLCFPTNDLSTLLLSALIFHNHTLINPVLLSLVLRRVWRWERALGVWKVASSSIGGLNGQRKKMKEHAERLDCNTEVVSMGPPPSVLRLCSQLRFIIARGYRWKSAKVRELRDRVREQASHCLFPVEWNGRFLVLLIMMCDDAHDLVSAGEPTRALPFRRAAGGQVHKDGLSVWLTLVVQSSAPLEVKQVWFGPRPLSWATLSALTIWCGPQPPWNSYQAGNTLTFKVISLELVKISPFLGKCRIWTTQSCWVVIQDAARGKTGQLHVKEWN